MSNNSRQSQIDALYDEGQRMGWLLAPSQKDLVKENITIGFDSSSDLRLTVRNTYPETDAWISNIHRNGVRLSDQEVFPSYEAIKKSKPYTLLKLVQAIKDKVIDSPNAALAREEQAPRKGHVTIFYSYALNPQDVEMFVELEKHLAILERSGEIAGWHKGNLMGGEELQQEIKKLNAAQVILLLLSSDFFASERCYEIMQVALLRHQRREAVVIPILLRPVTYEDTLIAKLQILPKDGRAVALWPQRDEAFIAIISELKMVLKSISPPSTSNHGQTPHSMELSTMVVNENIEQRMTADRQSSKDGTSPKAHQHTVGSSVRLKCDVLLVSATLVEIKAVLEACRQANEAQLQRYPFGNKTYYDLGIIGGARIFLVQTEMGTIGPASAILTVQEAINTLAPSSVIMVGIAFGMDSTKQHIGDILVSRQLLPYELQRVGVDAQGKSQVFERGDRVLCSPRLLDRFRSGVVDWSGVNVAFGLMLSGEKLVDSPEFLQYLKSLEPEAIGGDMEGAGLYSAAYLYRADWIMIKAVSDWADGRKTEDKAQHQNLAAKNAARFTVHVLRQGGFLSHES